MSIVVKNVSGVQKVYGGQVIANGASYTVQDINSILFSTDESLIIDVANTDAIINDGINDLGINDGIHHLKGYFHDPVGLRGSTDNTGIGNVGDSLKVVSSNDSNNPTIVGFSDQNHDAFTRLRVSNPTTLFSDAFTYDSHFDEHWSTRVSGGGSVTHDSTTGQRVLSVGSASGDLAILESRRRIQYVKGKSQLVYTTGSFVGLTANRRKRMGYFDESNGVYFETDDTSLYVVRRDSTSGSVVNNRTISTSWNMDTLDGSGDVDNPSGLTADPTKNYLFIIDFSWLGSNIIRYGIIVDGTIVYIHQENTSGVLTLPWMLSANLPMRYEIENTAAATGSDSIKITCMTVISEGGRTDLGHVVSVNTGTSAVSVNTTWKAVAGIRLKSTSLNAALKALSFDILPASGNNFLFYKVIYNGTLASPTWASLTDLTEGLSNTPNYTDGTGYELDSGYIDMNNGNGKNKADPGGEGGVQSDVYLGFDVASPRVADTLTLVCRTSSGSGSVYFSGQFREFF